MRKIIVVAATVMALGAGGGALTACGGSSSKPSATNSVQALTDWETKTLNDPGFKAVNAELSDSSALDITDPTQCKLVAHDVHSFAETHPKAPAGEADWNKTLKSLSAAVDSACKQDITAASDHSVDALKHMNDFEKELTKAYPQFDFNTFNSA